MPVYPSNPQLPEPLLRRSGRRVAETVGALALLTLAGAVQAQQTPSAAETDWRPRAQLPEAVQAGLPVFCSGAYLPPEGFAVEAPLQAPAGTEPLEASALSARYEINRELFLQGDVKLRQGGFSITGSEARFSQVTGEFGLVGPLVSRGQGFLLTGERAAYDTETGRLDLTDATFLLHQNELRGSALALSQPEPGRLSFRQGRLTTCAPGRNDWALVASNIELDREEGVGTARHVRLEVKDVPVFYWPYASFPIDDRRKSGFLFPAFGTSNTGTGGYVAAPYYLNLAPHYDMTLTPQYIHGRGFLGEAEGRYLSRFGETVLQLGYISNDMEYRSQAGEDDGERWALDLASEAVFGGGWSAEGDFAAVSDDDYLSDLNRSLDISQDTHLARSGSVRYSDRYQSFEASLNGYQTITDRIAPENRPYKQLPELRYRAQSGAGPLDASLGLQYVSFYRDNDSLTGADRTNGQRLRAVPELALSMRAPWGYARPSVELDYTRYQLRDQGSVDDSLDRTVPVFEWDSGLIFDRRSSLFETAYYQTLEPRLYYAWADADEQDQFPDFDSGIRSFNFFNLFTRNRFTGGDRVGDANQLTAALTTRINDPDTGAEWGLLSLGQVYYYDDREVTLDGRGSSSRSDSPLAAEAVLKPLAGLDVRTSIFWDARTGRTEEGRSQLVFHSGDYRYLATVGHSYSRGSFDQANIGGVVPVTDRVSLIGRWVYDSVADRTAGSLLGLEYNNCCWSLQLVSQNYLTSERELDNRVLFQVELKGMGGSGSSASRISEAIYGFEERERRRFGSRN